MEPEQSNRTVQTPTTHVLHTVTPLSKYLAMVLFVILPFLGGWIGYEYGKDETVVAVSIVEQVQNITQETEKSKQEKTDSENTSSETNVTEEKYLTVASDLNNLRNQDEVDTSDWLTYKSSEYGFSFKYPPDDYVVVEDSNFTLHSDVNYRHFLPMVWISDNETGNNTREEMNKLIYKYTNVVSISEVDGIPAFRLCTAEGGGCSVYVVTSKYIFRIGQLNNSWFDLSFDENVIGEVEREVDWPEQVLIPS